MNLKIQLQKNINLDPFLKGWLIPALKSNLKSKVLKNKFIICFYYKKELYQDLFLAIEYIDLIHIKTSNQLIISVNQNEKNREGTAKLYDICTAVNFGSLSNPAIPIFTKTFDYFAKNFWGFYKDYNLGILRNVYKII